MGWYSHSPAAAAVWQHLLLWAQWVGGINQLLHGGIAAARGHKMACTSK